MRHEEATDPAVMDTPDERPTGLAAITFYPSNTIIGLHQTFVPDEADLAGAAWINHNRVTQLLAELFRRSGELSKGVKVLNDRAQTHEALADDVRALQEQVGILFKANTAQAQEINELRAQLPLQRAS